MFDILNPERTALRFIDKREHHVVKLHRVIQKVLTQLETVDAVQKLLSYYVKIRTDDDACWAGKNVIWFDERDFMLIPELQEYRLALKIAEWLLENFNYNCNIDDVMKEWGYKVPNKIPEWWG